MNALAEDRRQDTLTEGRAANDGGGVGQGNGGNDVGDRPEPKQGRTMEFLYKSGARPLDGYTVKRGLGRGGFGEVYYAISDGGKEVALKLVQRHLDVELRGVAQCLNLKSPHLVTIYDVRQGETGENWIVMEYMAGASLQERIEQLGGKMPADEMFHWLSGIASAIDYLHQNGIVHRDLKPGNVFSEDDFVKVGDYGLSKFISHSRRSGQTQSVGTVHYMAPEISTGRYGRGIDVYSAAVMAFEMISGDVPFDGETAGEILMKHLTAEPALEKVDPPYRPIFAKALAKSPEDRFPSVRELHDALLTVAFPAARAATPVAPTASPRPIPKPEVPVAPPVPENRPIDITVAYEPNGDSAAPTAAGPQVRVPGAPVRVRAPILGLSNSTPPPPGTFKAKRRALSELLWAMFVAGLLSSVLNVVVMTAEVALDGGAPDLAGYAQMAVVATFASWGVLVFARWWEMYRPSLGARRLNMLLFGMVVGSLWMGLDVWLDRGAADDSLRRLFTTPLSLANAEKAFPTAAVYLSLGALAFAVPNWAKLACRTRADAFSLWRAISAGSVGVLLGWVFDAPSPLGIGAVLGVTAIVVQWVSPRDLVLVGARRTRRLNS